MSHQFLHEYCIRLPHACCLSNLSLEYTGWNLHPVPMGFNCYYIRLHCVELSKQKKVWHQVWNKHAHGWRKMHHQQHHWRQKETTDHRRSHSMQSTAWIVLFNFSFLLLRSSHSKLLVFLHQTKTSKPSSAVEYFLDKGPKSGQLV